MTVKLYCFGESGNAYKVALTLTMAEINAVAARHGWSLCRAGNEIPERLREKSLGRAFSRGNDGNRLGSLGVQRGVPIRATE